MPSPAHLLVIAHETQTSYVGRLHLGQLCHVLCQAFVHTPVHICVPAVYLLGQNMLQLSADTAVPKSCVLHHVMSSQAKFWVLVMLDCTFSKACS